ncbi:fibronectin type-III domain-containing protein 3a-like isoform X2 [Ambystoma mexicanum]|uniref:fibronectin type-III domain-containing protein 3a-like isoform X2 n=1 Tax=Ambystoma mexicanum TaxID=8296 RepID=UPI0037E99798
MADRPPPLEASSLLNDVPLLTHLVNGENTQQVILVQVNPGETFTIRTKDGHIQCIQGPAHVPMMSPNGSMPPIFVPPGYVSQVVEENGVRKVLVLPHSNEFHPSVHSPPPHVAHYMHSHHALLPHPPHSVYSPGTGDIPPQFIHQHQPAASHTYQEQATETESHKLQDFFSGFATPTVSDVQARSVVLSWNMPLISENGDGYTHSITVTFTYDVTLSNSGKNGRFRTVHIGEETSFNLLDLRPATDYHVRVSARCSSMEGSFTEMITFKTESCEPDPPAPPKLLNRTKNSLNLQWKASSDNGSKINAFLLEWDEGKNEPFKECYLGHLKQFKQTKLSPSTKYTFRLAAKNEIGISDFSETVLFYTAGSVPPAPLPPKLIQAGVTWLSLEWYPPNGVSSDEALTYILEMEEEASGYGFKPMHNGEELTCTVRTLRRSTLYKFRVFANNSEGRSNPSEIVEYSTTAEKPGPPSKPSVKGKIHALNIKVNWDAPKDDGGSDISEYVLEISDTLNGNTWDAVYSGLRKEHVCDHLKPGSWYRLQVYCINNAGRSPVSDILTVQTAAVTPGQCAPPHLAAKAKTREVSLNWVPPLVDGGSTVTEYTLEMADSEHDGQIQVYQGPDLTYTVKNLLPGRIYFFWLKATNKVGCGPYSDKAEIRTAPGPPDPCRRPSIICKTATCVTVTWESPFCNGAEITDYRLEWGRTEGCMQIIYTGPFLIYEVKGLTPATTYYCRVQAANEAGMGLFGEIGIVTTPVSAPAAVSVLQVLDEQELEIPLSAQSTCLAIQWTEPCCHGMEITGYNIEYGEKQLVAVANVSRYTLENLQPDTLYRVRVQAVNSCGPGPFSHSIKAKTKPLPPNAPHLECVVFSHQSLKLKWGESASKPFIVNLAHYNLLMEDGLGRFVTIYSGPCHTYKIQRLNESTEYNFKIQAYNDAGEGPFSEVYTFSTIKCPPSSLKAPKVNQHKSNLCEVTWEPVQPMKGDNIVYILQHSTGRDFEQLHKGPETSFKTSFQINTEYRFRVCAGRQFHDSTGLQELYGPYSPITVFSSQRQETANIETEVPKTKKKLISDELFAFFLLLAFAVVAILFAVVIQYFVIK